MTNEMITYLNFTKDPFKHWSPSDVTKGASKVLEWAFETYKDSIIYSCSFGAEGIVLIDLISKIKKDAKVFFLDTGFHFQETLDLIDKVKATYPELRIHLKRPKITDDQNISTLWKNNPDQCCFIRKIKPLEEVLTDVPAWISGLRREQSLSRSKTNFVNKDHRFKSIKICPLIYWTSENVWDYIKKFNLPYNELHDQNYPSIGCIPCTTPVTNSRDFRSGRWAGLEKTECGLHTLGSSTK